MLIIWRISVWQYLITYQLILYSWTSSSNCVDHLALLSLGSSLINVKQNITTTIAYPFTIIKPSWEEGDVTLKDINQRIHAPPKPPPEILGTSAFSGKPVIGKTRIRTEGGKGSITILRTKGWGRHSLFNSHSLDCFENWVILCRPL